MKKQAGNPAPSEFKDLPGIEYFDFEEDFIEKNIRCIPMIVRLKLDSAGIKLKLDEWSKLTVEERIELATRQCSSDEEAKSYRDHAGILVKKRSGKEATDLPVNANPEWINVDKIPDRLADKLREISLTIRLEQWVGLNNLQRFALLKLCRPGHENKNFPKALIEFGLSSSISRLSGSKTGT